MWGQDSPDFSTSQIDQLTESKRWIGIFMRAIVSNLTAAMLIVHALVGCCGRHDCDVTTCNRSEISDSLAAGCCHHDHAPPSQEDERPIGPCDCTLNCKALCFSLPPEKTLLDAGLSVLCLDVVNTASSATALDASMVLCYCDATRAWRGPAPPVRLHLLHQILVV
jgi:hypothetical protein